MGRQGLGLSQRCIKFTSVSITAPPPRLGLIGESYSWKHGPSDGLSLNSAPAYQVLGGKPAAKGHGVLSSESLVGKDGLWDQCQAILSCQSAAYQRPAPVDGRAGRDFVEAQVRLPLLLYPHLTFYSMKGLGNAPVLLQQRRAKLTCSWNRWKNMLELSPLLPKGIAFKISSNSF